MPRADFERHLRALQDDLLVLGSMVEKSIARALDALKRRDGEAALRVVQEDDFIDQKRSAIEEQCVDLIATQQPLARDLRSLFTVLQVSAELERMGDYAEGIAKISIMLGEEPLLKPPGDVARMADKATDMLRRSLDALVNRDIVAAQQVGRDDDEVDALQDKVYSELVSAMMSNPNNIRGATHLLWVAHDIERIADRATNIAERVLYLVTGKLTELNVSRY